jgi:S1-C subfamily serine protease
MKLHLTVLETNGLQRPFAHDGPVITLGRDPRCELPLEPQSITVSWNHARIELKPGVALLQDLQSTNGTFVNDQRVVAPKVLRPGDRIQLGTKGPTLRVDHVEYDAGEFGPMPTVPVTLLAAAPPPVADDGHTTRRMLVQAVARHRRNLFLVASLSALFIAVLSAAVVGLAGLLGYQQKQLSERNEEISELNKTMQARLQQAQADVAKARAEWDDRWHQIPSDGKEIYRPILRATVFIYDNRPNGGAGTGALIDPARKWVLTAYHVTPSDAKPVVFFAELDKDRKPIPELQHYINHKDRHISAKVIAHDSLRDLAILELESLPEKVAPLRVARASAEPGERVHTVGNPAASSALWVYNSGSVRAVVKKMAVLSPVNQKVDCWTLEVQNPINPGDSGGPLVNDHVELVGVNSYVSLKGTLVNSCIDVREVHAVLEGIK